MNKFCKILLGLCLLPLGAWANTQCSPEIIQEALDAGWDQRVIQSICPPPKPEPSPESLIPDNRPCTDYDRARMLQADLGADAISKACKENFTFRKNCTGPDRAKMVLAGVDPQTIIELCGEGPELLQAPIRRPPPPAPGTAAPAPVSEATSLAPPPAAEEPLPLMEPAAESLPEPIAIESDADAFVDPPKPKQEPPPVEEEESSLWFFSSGDEEPVEEADAMATDVEEADAMSLALEDPVEAIPVDGGSLWRWGLAYGSQEGTASGTLSSATLSTSGAMDFYGLWQDSSGLVLGGKLETFKLEDSAGTTSLDYAGGAASAGWLWSWGDLSLGGLGSLKYGNATLASPVFETTTSSMLLSDVEGVLLYDLWSLHLGLSYGQTFGEVGVSFRTNNVENKTTFSLGSHTALLIGFNF